MFHPDFDEKKISILSGGSPYLDDYTRELLGQFSLVLLVDPKIKNKINTKNLIHDYQKAGGNVLTLNSRYVPYGSLHKRSSSIWTEKSAWSYSEEDKERLSKSFKRLINNGRASLEVKIDRFTPEDILLNFSTQNDNVVLQYSDSFFPGWKAEIDGQKTNVYMADGLVKGILIKDKGKHIVRFYYDPDSFKKGAAVTLTTILILAVLLLRKWYINKKKYTC